MYIHFGVRAPTSLLVTEVGFLFSHVWHVSSRESLTYSSVCPRKQTVNFVYFNLSKQRGENPKNPSDKVSLWRKLSILKIRSFLVHKELQLYQSAQHPHFELADF